MVRKIAALKHQIKKVQKENSELRQQETDYTQIVGDLQALKTKYDSFKVEHAKTETENKALKVRIQSHLSRNC